MTSSKRNESSESIHLFFLVIICCIKPKMCHPCLLYVSLCPVFFMSLARAPNVSSYFFTIFLFLLSFFRSSTLLKGTLARCACSQWTASPKTHTWTQLGQAEFLKRKNGKKKKKTFFVGNDEIIHNPIKASSQKGILVLLMEEIRRSPVEVGSLSQYLQGFMHPRWLFGISSMNSISIYISHTVVGVLLPPTGPLLGPKSRL